MENSSLVNSTTSYERGHSADGSSSKISASSLNSDVISHVSGSTHFKDSVVHSPSSAEPNIISSVTCGPGNGRKAHQSTPPALSLEIEQSSVTSLQSPLIKSLISPTAEGLTVDSRRPALFDDHVAPSYVPGSLHLAPDNVIERLVERLGSVPLIRQLAGDLAHRDRELVLFRLKAEERERTLKKMLVEVEVSNADIEKRLASCLSKPDGNSDRNGDNESYTESINQMMQQALDEEDAFSVVDTTDTSHHDVESTEYSSSANSRPNGWSISADSSSVKSFSSQKSKLRGWKDYFWGQKPNLEATLGSGTRTGSSSTTTSGRKPAKATSHQDRFVPSTRADDVFLPRSASTVSMQSTRAPTGSRSPRQPSSTWAFDHNPDEESPFQSLGMAVQSVTPSGLFPDKGASLALKLVSDARSLAQYGYTTPSTSTSPVNTRAMTVNQPSKFSSQKYSTPEIRSSGARDDLQRIIAMNTAKQNSYVRQRAASISSTTSMRAPNPSGPRIPNTGKDRASGVVHATQSTTPPDESLGPVEMDTIVPHATQPPTLLQSWNEHYPADYLTDRFGFIYDKRRRSNSTNSETTVDTIPGEHVESRGSPGLPAESNAQDHIAGSQGLPSSNENGTYSSNKPLETLETPRQPTSILGRMTRPSASTLVPPSGKLLSEVPLALRTRSGATTDEESTVRLLLTQLSDMHDTLQRDRSIKWNEFLRKVRAERRRGDVEEKGMPEVLMADGELIGVSAFGNTAKGGKQKWKEFRRLVLSGIPVSYRWKVWVECSGAVALRVPGYYDELLQAGDDDPHIMSQICMDINRTLTDNIFFRKGPGVQKLKQVLIAYSRRNPAVGYCQGMNMIAASLLLIMPTEEDAFWVLVSIIENILPKTYFEQSLLASRADQTVLKQYVKEVLPQLDSHLQKLGVELEALTFQWFLSIFTDCLAAEALFRVWDVLLCLDGSTFLFQTALALLRLNESALLECDIAAAVYSYLNSNMTHQGISIDGLIQASDALRSQVKKEDVELRRELAINKELALATGEDRASMSSRSGTHLADGGGSNEGPNPREATHHIKVDTTVNGGIVEGPNSASPPEEGLSNGQVGRTFTPSPPLAPWL